jgi:hypothetical protein
LGQADPLYAQPLEFAVLKSGKEFSKEIRPGHHRLHIDNTFWPKTVEFDVRAGEEVHFRAWNRRRFGSWTIEILGAGPVYLTVERVESNAASLEVTQVSSSQRQSDAFFSESCS